MTLTGDAKREYQRKWIRARRQAWINENGPCVDCGSEEELEVDHVDATTKLMQPAALWSMSPNNPKRISELAKCIVRCKPCHAIKTKAEGSSPRGDRHGVAKHSDQFVADFRELWQDSPLALKEIAQRTGIAPSTVRNWLRGTRRTLG